MFLSSWLRKRVPTLHVSDHKQRSYLEFKVAKSCVMSAIAVERLLTWSNRTCIGVAHHVTALIFYNITRCYGKHVAAFAVAVATGDIIKYQSFVYGSFVWGIHMRYNKSLSCTILDRWLKIQMLSSCNENKITTVDVLKFEHLSN